MGKVTDLAEKVLNENDLPMTAKQIYDYAVEHHSELVKETFSGETPDHTLGAILYTSAKKQSSKFNKFKNDRNATKFGLKRKDYGNISSIANNDLLDEDVSIKETWKEKDLHRFLVSFMDDCYCKTINQSKSSSVTRYKNTWVHPDIIGVKFFKEYYDDITMKLMSINKENTFELYSFEMKQCINLANVNEEFLQAASNSSWANYGYLVAKDIDDNNDLKEKLNRLNRIFGIGVIKLDVKAYSESKILYEAQKREIDYDTIDEMIELNNDDINDFFKEVMAICGDGRIEVVSSIFDKKFESDVDGETFAKNKNMI